MNVVPVSQRSQKNRYYDLFGIVFGATFVLTFLLFPFVIFASPDVGERDGGLASVVIFTYVIGALAFAVPLLIKSSLIAPLAFAVVVVALDRVLPGFLVFVLASSVSAFAACYLGHVINVDLAPPAVNWDPTRKQFAMMLATTATVIAAFVSSITYVASVRETTGG